VIPVSSPSFALLCAAHLKKHLQSRFGKRYTHPQPVRQAIATACAVPLGAEHCTRSSMLRRVLRLLTGWCPWLLPPPPPTPRWKIIVYYLLLPLAMLLDILQVVFAISMPLVPLIMSWLTYTTSLDLGGYTHTHTHTHTHNTTNFSITNSVRNETCSWTEDRWWKSPNLVCTTRLRYTWSQAFRHSFMGRVVIHTLRFVATGFEVLGALLTMVGHILLFFGRVCHYVR